jgi:hypothetical protein
MTFNPDQYAPNKRNRLFGFELGEEASTKIRGLVKEFHEDKRVNNEDAAYKDIAGENTVNKLVDDEVIDVEVISGEVIKVEGFDDEYYEGFDGEWGNDEETATKDIANKDKSKFENSIDGFLRIIRKSVSDYLFLTKGGGIDFDKIAKKEILTYLRDLATATNKIELLISKLDNEHSELNRYMFRRWAESNYSTVTKEGGKDLYPPSIIQEQLPNLERMLEYIPEEVRKRGGDKELDNVRPKGGRPSKAPYGLGIPIYKYYMETLSPYAMKLADGVTPIYDSRRETGLNPIFRVILKEAKIDIAGHDMSSYIQNLKVYSKQQKLQ